MAEDIKPKATLIKQVKTPAPTQEPQKPAVENTAATQQPKKVVVIKKKPVVVVKAQPKVEAPAPAAPQAEQTPVQKPVETAPVAKPAPAPQPVKAAPATPAPVAPQTVKKVVKKVSNAASSTINNGPVIISGKNLPPINFKPESKSGTSRPVGSVGGVTYDRDGQRIPNNRFGNKPGMPPRGPRPDGQHQFRNGQSYTPNKTGQGGFRKPGMGNGPRPFPGKDGKPGFKGGFGGGGMESLPEGKNKRVFQSDKGKDRRKDKTQEEELEFKNFKKKSSEPVAVAAKDIEIMANITVGDLAKKMNVKATEIIGKLMGMGMMVTINQSIDSDTATILAEEYGCRVHLIDLYEETQIVREAENEEDVVTRAPIVTVMGHVDHGKTKLLDAIRSTNVVAGEFGGITQHIGAYKVHLDGEGDVKGDVVFLDTPGHAAFTMMRARGAQLTDIVVLVVAANDGVMPQTLEAIDHAKAAKVPIIVAINKVDLPEAKPERVMQQLSEKGLMPEEWGGDTMYCQISALKKQGIDKLLEAILLQAEMMELKANPKVRAEGKVLEARIDQGRGIVASVIVERGTLHQGDHYVAGIYAGRVRAMFDDKGRKIKEAGPSTPVEVIGLSEVPSAGDPFQVCEDEKTARSIGTKRQELKRQEQANRFKSASNWDELSKKMIDGDVKELNVIIKGDVQGSVEALQMALEKLSTPEIRVNVIRAAAGAIIEDDINLASASENSALVIGFNVRPTPRAQARADEERIEIRKYTIIYNVVDDVKAAMEGLLSPEKTEVDVGTATVRQVFKVPKVGIVAGCFVVSGSVKRNNWCRVIRDNIQINKDLVKITSLKRFKDDVREVAMGFECGIGIEGFQDLQEGDTFEFVEIKEVARKLEDTGVII